MPGDVPVLGLLQVLPHLQDASVPLSLQVLALLGHVSVTTNPDQACLYVVLDPDDLDSLQTLEHWAGDGRNHIVIFSDKKSLDEYYASKAVIVSSEARSGVFRLGYDLTIPPLTSDTLVTWELLQPLVPITQEYLLEFELENVTEPESSVKSEHFMAKNFGGKFSRYQI